MVGIFNFVVSEFFSLESLGAFAFCLFSGYFGVSLKVLDSLAVPWKVLAEVLEVLVLVGKVVVAGLEK